MQYLSLMTLLFILMGCSDKSSNINSDNSKYQRFLNYQSDKQLKSDIESF